MIRIAVFPVPIPRKVRPGAMAFIVPIEEAVTGAGRVPETETPVPSCILLVRSAANANAA